MTNLIRKCFRARDIAIAERRRVRVYAFPAAGIKIYKTLIGKQQPGIAGEFVIGFDSRGRMFDNM